LPAHSKVETAEVLKMKALNYLCSTIREFKFDKNETEGFDALNFYISTGFPDS
jgi:hypothetical protein